MSKQCPPDHLDHSRVATTIARTPTPIRCRHPLYYGGSGGSSCQSREEQQVWRQGEYEAPDALDCSHFEPQEAVHRSPEGSGRAHKGGGDVAGRPSGTLRSSTTRPDSGNIAAASHQSSHDSGRTLLGERDWGHVQELTWLQMRGLGNARKRILMRL